MDNWILIKRGDNGLLEAREAPSDIYDYAVVMGEEGGYRRFPDRKAAENWAIDELMEIQRLKEIGIFRELHIS